MATQTPSLTDAELLYRFLAEQIANGGRERSIDELLRIFGDYRQRFLNASHAADEEPGTEAEWKALERATFSSAEFQKITEHLRSSGKASA